MREVMMKNQVFVNHQKKMDKTTYHIYLEDKVLFKNLEKETFDIVWDRIYSSYHNDDLTYIKVDGEHSDNNTEHSY